MGLRFLKIFHLTSYKLALRISPRKPSFIQSSEASSFRRRIRTTWSTKSCVSKRSRDEPQSAKGPRDLVLGFLLTCCCLFLCFFCPGLKLPAAGSLWIESSSLMERRAGAVSGDLSRETPCCPLRNEFQPMDKVISWFEVTFQDIVVEPGDLGGCHCGQEPMEQLPSFP